jgi:hypothetical protein
MSQEIPSIDEAKLAQILAEKGDIDPQVQLAPKDETAEPLDPAEPKTTLQQRYLLATNGAVHRNYDRTRRPPWVKDEIGRIIEKRVGPEQRVVENGLAQVLDTNTSPSLTYIPPEDPQILVQLNRSKIDPSQGTRIPHGSLDPLNGCTSLVRSATNDPQIADILIEEQERGNSNGPGPNQLEPFSLNTPEADDYSPDSRP